MKRVTPLAAALTASLPAMAQETAPAPTVEGPFFEMTVAVPETNDMARFLIDEDGGVKDLMLMPSDGTRLSANCVVISVNPYVCVPIPTNGGGWGPMMPAPDPYMLMVEPVLGADGPEGVDLRVLGMGDLTRIMTESGAASQMTIGEE